MSIKIDKTNRLNEQLKEKANQVDVNNSLLLKADKTTTDNIQSQVTGLASGSPKAVTLVSQMTDTTKNYVYTGSEGGYTAGNWYYHNGSAWVSGGIYQSTGIADGGIKPENISGSSILSNVNLFDKTRTINNYYITVGTLANYGTSDYIRIKPNTTYTFNKMYRYELYNSNKVARIAADTGHGTISLTTGSNDTYIRFSYLLTDINTIMVFEGGTIPDNYVPFVSNIYNVEWLNIPQKTIMPTDISENIPYVSANLYNPNKRVLNNYLNLNLGGVEANYHTSDYIQVSPNTEYTINAATRYVIYNSSKLQLVGVDSALTETTALTFTTPENAAYLRIAISNTYLNNDIMVVQGNAFPPSFIPYIDDKFMIDWLRVGAEQIINLSDSVHDIIKGIAPWKGKKMNCIGDSITRGYAPEQPDAVPPITSGSQIPNPYAILVGQYLGLSTVRNYGIDGSTVVPYNGSVAGRDLISRYANMDNDADIITVMVGANDYVYVPLGSMSDSPNTTTYYGGLKTLFEGLINKYPGKLIIAITPLMAWGNRTVRESFANAVKEVAAYYLIPCIDLFHNSGINPSIPSLKSLLINDELHPNQAGQYIMARKIAGFINAQ